MAEVFMPRKNMHKHETHPYIWECRDENDNLICDGGPSIIWNTGNWYFYITDIGFHRLDGPATSNGEWCIHDKNVTKEIHDFVKENNINLNNLSEEDKVLIALKFG